MTEEVNEALAAITPAPAVEKIPEGKLLVGIELWKDPRVSGNLTTLVGWRGSDGRRVDWRPVGRIVVLRGGEMVAGNWLAGRFKEGDGWRVIGTRVTWCTKCTVEDAATGKSDQKPVPACYACWNAKDRLPQAREVKSLWGLIRKYGCCECGSRVVEDVIREKEALTSFKHEILKSFSERTDQVPRLVPPTFFTLVKVGSGKLPSCWDWLQQGLRTSHRADGTPTPCEAVPYRKDDKSPYLYNPGKWFGYVDSLEDPALAGLVLRGGIDGGAIGDVGSIRFNPRGNDAL